MNKTALQKAIEWRLQKLALYAPKVEDLENSMGTYFKPKEVGKIQQDINAEAEKSMALRHPFLTGIPTLGIWPTMAHENVRQKVMRDLLRGNPAYAKAKLERDRHREQMALERMKAEAPAKAVMTATLPAMVLADALAGRRREQEDTNENKQHGNI